MTERSRQLALPFVHRSPFAVEGFIAAPSNERARAYLATGPDEWPFRRLWLWGPPGCGKTHLLHLWLGNRPDSALLEAAAIPRVALDGVLPTAGGLAIDDADQVRDEAALLHVLNVAAERHVPLVLASRVSPNRHAVALFDLQSRLRATLAASIDPPEDHLLDALLARLVADRQVAVSPAVGRYLRARLPRDPDTLRRAVERLDAASLAGGRPITVALAGCLIDELSDAEPSVRRVSASGPDLV